jgi:hypothetical protein
MRVRLLAALTLCALALSGCYVSTRPLIAPAGADYPVADGARFAAFAPQGRGWTPLPSRTVWRRGAYYVYQDDGRPKPSLPFLLKRIAPGLYVAQLSDHADPAKAREYVYELISFDGKTAIQQQGACPARPEWVRRGLIERIENTTTPRCIFSSLEKLAVVLRESARNAAPEAKYVLTSGR